MKLFNGLAISQPQHLNRGLEHLRSYSNQSDLDMWAGALMIFRSRAFISIVKILPPEEEANIEAQAWVQATMAVLYSGLEPAIECPSQLSWASWEGIVSEPCVLSIIAHGY